MVCQTTTARSVLGSIATGGALLGPGGASCVRVSKATPPGPPGVLRAARIACWVPSKPPALRGALSSTATKSLRGPVASPASRRSAPGGEIVAAGSTLALVSPAACTTKSPPCTSVQAASTPSDGATRASAMAPGVSRCAAERDQRTWPAREGDVVRRVLEEDPGLARSAGRRLVGPHHEGVVVVAQHGGQLRRVAGRSEHLGRVDAPAVRHPLRMDLAALRPQHDRVAAEVHADVKRGDRSEALLERDGRRKRGGVVALLAQLDQPL